MTRIVPFAGLALAWLAAWPAAAQHRAELVPFAGYMVFDDLLRGPLGTSLTHANGSVVGVQTGLPVAGPLSLYAGAGLARTDLTVGLPLLGGLAVGQTRAWMLDGGLQLRPENRSAFTPLLQLGAGVAHYRLDNAILATESTSPILSVAAGLDVAFGPSVALRLMAKDYAGRFDFREALLLDVQGRTAHHIGLIAGLRVGL